MNRRNVLIGLGTVAAGGGAALGTGAFSQVEASRTVGISTAGDSAALLSLSVDTSYNGISDGSATDNGTNSENTIQVDLGQINDDATTTFDEALTIENNGSSSVDISIEDSNPDGITFSLPSDPASVTANDDASDSDQTTADITVDTTQSVSDGDVTIIATDNS